MILRAGGAGRARRAVDGAGVTLLVVSPDYASHLFPLLALAGAWAADGERVVVATGSAVAPHVARAGFERVDLVLGRGSNAGTARPGDQPTGEAENLRAFFAATREGMIPHPSPAGRAAPQRPAVAAARGGPGHARSRPRRGSRHHPRGPPRLRGRAGSAGRRHPVCRRRAGTSHGAPRRRRGLRGSAGLAGGVRPRPGRAGRAAAPRGRCDAGASPTTGMRPSPSSTRARRRSPTPSGSTAMSSSSATRRRSTTRSAPPTCRAPTPSSAPRCATRRSTRRQPRGSSPAATARSWWCRSAASSRPAATCWHGWWSRSGTCRCGGWAGCASPSRPAPPIRPSSARSPTSGWSGRSCPRSPCVQHAALAITHGGNNGVTEALSAGVPLLALPFSTDQFAVAADLERTSLGRALDPNRASADEIAAAADALLAGPAAVRADALGAELRADPGPARARRAAARIRGSRPGPAG